MVTAHHWSHVPRKLDVREQLLASGGMLADERPLFLRQLARLVQHFRRYDQLAHVMEQRADAEPEQRGFVQASLGGERPREVGDALAMTLRMLILGLDRLAPLPHHVQEVAFEPRHSATHVGELVAGTQLDEAGVRAVECLQRFAIATQPSEQLGQLAIRVAFQRQVFGRCCDLASLNEMRFCGNKVVCLAGDDAVDLGRLAVRAGIVEVLGERHGPIAPLLGLREIPLLDLEGRGVHLELHAGGQPAQRIRDRERFRERLFCCVEPAKRHVGEAEVVQRDDDVVEQGMNAAVREGFLEIAQCLAKITANAGHRPQVRHHVDLQARIRGAGAALQRLLEELLGMIQVALPPPYCSEHVEGVSQRVALLAEFGGGNGGDGAIFSGPVVGIHLVRAGDPAQQHGGQRRRRRGQGA